MSEIITDDQERQIRAAFEKIPPAKWVQDMIDYRRRTGNYRPEDLRRLLGDPNKAVEVGPNSSLSSFWAASDDR